MRQSTLPILNRHKNLYAISVIWIICLSIRICQSTQDEDQTTASDIQQSNIGPATDSNISPSVSACATTSVIANDQDIPANESQAALFDASAHVASAHDNSDVRAKILRWTKIYHILFESNCFMELKSEDVQMYLYEMAQLENSGIFTDLTTLERAGFDTRLSRTKYQAIKQTLSKKRLTINWDATIPETLLQTFDLLASNCNDVHVRRLRDLASAMKRFPIRAIIDENVEAQFRECWFRYIESVQYTTTLLGQSDLNELNNLLSLINPGTDVMLIELPANKKFGPLTKNYANIIAQYMFAKSLQRLHRGPMDFLSEFNHSFKETCTQLVGLESSIMIKIIKLINTIGPRVDYMYKEHFDLLNLYRMCYAIVYDKDLSDHVMVECESLCLQNPNAPQVIKPSDNFDEADLIRKPRKSIRMKRGSKNKDDTDLTDIPARLSIHYEPQAIFETSSMPNTEPISPEEPIQHTDLVPELTTQARIPIRISGIDPDAPAFRDLISKPPTNSQPVWKPVPNIPKINQVEPSEQSEPIYEHPDEWTNSWSNLYLPVQDNVEPHLTHPDLSITNPLFWDNLLGNAQQMPDLAIPNPESRLIFESLPRASNDQQEATRRRNDKPPSDRKSKKSRKS